MNRKRTLFLFFFAIVFYPLQNSSPALASEDSDHSPRFLVHLLDYLAVDYGGAVRNGNVLSVSEYKEQLEFVKTAAELTQTLPEIKSSTEIQAMTGNLSNLIRTKADPEKVAALARQVESKVIELAHIPVAPLSWPDLNQGRQLFVNTCAKCHGNEGRGDGPSAAALNPKPVNLLDPARMDKMTPFQVFNAVRLGVPNTGMAGFPSFSDQDTWNAAFYVLSIRYQSLKDSNDLNQAFGKVLGWAEPEGLSGVLPEVSTLSDTDLEKGILSSTSHFPQERKLQLAALRLHSAGENFLASLDFARFSLEDALADYQSHHFESASKKALAAYVEGVEPVEPRLKANDPRAVLDLEQLMGLVRTAIHEAKPVEDVKLAVQKAVEALNQARGLLQQQAPTPWLTFTLAFGILIREGFEAVLLIVAFLGVLRASKASQAEHWVHGGWMAAVACGVLAWFFSGWLLNVSGLGRELMEAVTGLLTVVILLYIGFWLHSRTEVHRWKAFIETKVQAAVENRNRIQLALIAFLAAFREAIETVLFLRAIWLEGGDETKRALGLGVAGAFVCILFLGWLLLTFSTRLPIKTLFNGSSMVMVALAVILTGKAVHSLQEIDLLPITLSPLNLHGDWLGLYPTVETTLGQLLVLGLSIFLWLFGKRPPASHK